MTQGRMIEYIREEPEAVANTLLTCRTGIAQLLKVVAANPPKHVIVTGLGSSYTAAQMVSPLLRRCIGIPTTITVATELGLDLGLALGPDTLVILASRSGERGGIVDALAAARKVGATCVAVTGVESSLLAQEADVVIVTGEGPETTYAKTKSVIATATALIEIGLALDTDTLRSARLEAALARVPELLASEIAEIERNFDAKLVTLMRYETALISGTAGNQGVAQEGSLKIQETAAVTCEWDETGSVLYGTVPILNPAWLFITLVTRADLELNRQVLGVVGRFGAYRLGIAEKRLDLEDCTDLLIRVESVGEPLLAPLFYLAPVHLLAYHFSVGRGLNPDEPLYADMLLEAMLPPGRNEPDWRPVAS